MPSWKTPTGEQVEAAISLLARPEQRRHFFDKLQNPNWLTPLEARGFFNSPPPAVSDPTRGTIHFPPWPAASYLSRMASVPDAQNDVLRIAISIPATDNIMVHQDLANIAAQLPAAMAAQLATKAPEWLASPYDRLIGEQLGTVIYRLATGGEPEAAEKLARNALAIRKEGHGLKAHFDPWHYGRIIEVALPALANSIGIKALALLADLLEVAAPPYKRDAAPTAEDGSTIWNPKVEVDDVPPDVRSLLVSATRNIAAQIARQSPETASNVVTTLRTRPTAVFHRIALDILRRERTALPDLVASTLTDPALLDNTSLRHEYQQLLHEAFTTLQPQDREPILALINDGPPNGKYIEWEAFCGKQPTIERQERYKKLWQRRHLTPVADYLTGPLKERYEEIIGEVGPEEPEHEGGFIGPSSPISNEELSSMTPAAIVEYLANWTPATIDEFKPSRAGLGVDVQNMIAANPTMFDAVAGQLQHLHPTYVRSYYYGLREAIQKGQAVSWQPILDLAEWVVGQPTASPDRERDLFHEDTSWASSRRAISSVLQLALTTSSAKKADDAGALPIGQRELVWKIISVLTEDPDPTPAFEAGYGEDMDASHVAINTTRGEAMIAVIEYAIWVRHHRPDIDSFFGMPEVRAVLDQHLTRDPSVAVRSVYGRFFPWLVLLDGKWAAGNVKGIFGDENGKAAWDAYLTFCAAYDNAVALLPQYYESAVDNLDPDRNMPERRNKPDPDEHLGEHLMAQYWRGQLSLNGGLVQRFFERAPSHVRAHVMVYLGRALYATEGTVPAPILVRLTTLWEARRTIAATNVDEHRAELTAFGWWFAAGKLDLTWALTQLRDVVQLARAIDPDTMVLEQLATVASAHPGLAVECLQAIATLGPLWVVLAAEEHVRRILTSGLHSDDPQARDNASKLIHDLGVRGLANFRSLLQPTL